MITPEIPIDEAKRFLALKEYSILDTLPEKEFDDITYLASQICKTPISLISLIDDKRQWFKSHFGLNATETPKEIAFCAHAINDKNNILVVPDSRNDVRFHDNPLVTDDPYVIFYVGVPLVNDEGYALGTLCVIDNKPNSLDEIQINSLKALTNQLLKLFELRKKSIVLEQKNKELVSQNKSLEKFARVAAHDIKSPLINIIMLSKMLEEQIGEIDELSLELLKDIGSSSQKLMQLIDGILNYSKNTSLLTDEKEEINISELLKEITSLVDLQHEVKFEINIDENAIIYSNRIALEQIMINLLNNGIKYNDKNEVVISINIKDMNDFVKINIIDNGIGILEEDKERIFQIFETTLNVDRNGERGNGIGLATVKSLVEGMGGAIKVVSETGKFSNFEFTIKK